MGNAASAAAQQDLNEEILEIQKINEDIKAVYLLTNAAEQLDTVPKKDSVEVRVEVIGNVFGVVTQVYEYAQKIYKLVERLLESMEKMKHILTKEIEAKAMELKEETAALQRQSGTPVGRERTREAETAIETVMLWETGTSRTTSDNSSTSVQKLSSDGGNTDKVKRLLQLEKMKKQLFELENLISKTEEMFEKIRNSENITLQEKDMLINFVHELQRIEKIIIDEQQYVREQQEKAEQKRKEEEKERIRKEKERKRLEEEERLRQEKEEIKRKKREAEERAKEREEENRRKRELIKQREKERRQQEAEERRLKREEMERQRKNAEEQARVKAEKDRIRRAAALEAKVKAEEQRKLEQQRRQEREMAEQERKKREAEEAEKARAEEERQRLEAEEMEKIRKEEERVRLVKLQEEEAERIRLEEEEATRIKEEEERKQREAEEQEMLRLEEERKRLEQQQKAEEERIKRDAEEKARKKEEKRRQREAENEKRLLDAVQLVQNEMTEKIRQEQLAKEEVETCLKETTEENEKLKQALTLAVESEEKCRQELLQREEEYEKLREADERALNAAIDEIRKEAGDKLREELAAKREKRHSAKHVDVIEGDQFTDTTNILFKKDSSCDEVDSNPNYLKFHKGTACLMSTKTGTVDPGDLFCETKEQISDGAAASITGVDAAAISEEVFLGKSSTSDTMQVSGRLFVPHRPVSAAHRVSIMGQVDGKRWRSYEPVYPVPRSLDKEMSWVGAEVTFTKSVRVVAICVPEEQQDSVDVHGKKIHSTVDSAINLSIPANAFKQSTPVILGVMPIDKPELQLYKRYHTNCENVLGCSSLVQIRFGSPPAKDFQVWIVAKANIDTKTFGNQYIVFLEDGRGWRQVPSEWKDDTHRQVITVPKGQPTYSVIGIRMAPDTGLKEAKTAVETLNEHTKEIHVGLVFRQRKSTRDEAVLVCVQYSVMGKKVRELTKHGYSQGGGESEKFCIRDDGVLLVTLSGNIGSPSGSGGKLRLQYRRDTDVVMETIPLQVLDPTSQSSQLEYSGTVHVVKECEPEISILTEEIYLPKE